MRALFLFNDWSMDLTGYDLIICGHNYDPVALRRRPDISPAAKLAAYVCFESIEASPLGIEGSCNRRIYQRLMRPELLLTALAFDRDFGPAPEGFVPCDGMPPELVAFSSYPWPKAPETARQNRVDLAPTMDRVRAQAEAYAHEISDGWDMFYVDACRPTPPHLLRRYEATNVLTGYRRTDDLFNYYRSDALLTAFLRYLREMRKEPILGNTRGYTSPYLDGICIEWGAQQPWNPNGISQVRALAMFQMAASWATRNGRGIWSVDFAERFNVPGLVMPGVIVRNRPPSEPMAIAMKIEGQRPMMEALPSVDPTEGGGA